MRLHKQIHSIPYVFFSFRPFPLKDGYHYGSFFILFCLVLWGRSEVSMKRKSFLNFLTES